MYVWGPPDARWASCDGRVYRSVAAAPRAGETDNRLLAPMPSIVRKVFAQPGKAVVKGEVLLLLEAMKMEMPITAPTDATVTAVHCREGERVQPDTLLIELDA